MLLVSHSLGRSVNCTKIDREYTGDTLPTNVPLSSCVTCSDFLSTDHMSRGSMKFLCSVTILLIFLLLMLLTKLHFKSNKASRRNERLQELRRPLAKIIIDDDFALSTTSAPSTLSEKKTTKVSINEDLPQFYKQRREHVEEICQKYHEELENEYKRFQPGKTWRSVVRKADVFHSRNKVPFIWCRVPKASSQSWNDLFINTW